MTTNVEMEPPPDEFIAHATPDIWSSMMLWDRLIYEETMTQGKWAAQAIKELANSPITEEEEMSLWKE